MVMDTSGGGRQPSLTAHVAVRVDVHEIVEINNKLGDERLVLLTVGRGQDREAEIHPEAVVVGIGAGWLSRRIGRVPVARRTDQVLDVAAGVRWRREEARAGLRRIGLRVERVPLVGSLAR